MSQSHPLSNAPHDITVAGSLAIRRNRHDRIEIGDSDARSIAFDLRIAAERYDADASELLTPDPPPAPGDCDGTEDHNEMARRDADRHAARLRLAEQFTFQAARSRAMADQLDEV